nr:MAG TPA: major capsid protein [Caudoviricetes sp.]
MIEAKIEAKAKLIPYAKLDTSLQGTAGDTKTVPSWNYVGDAEDFDVEKAAETDAEMETTNLTATSATFTIKCAGKSVSILQTAINSGLGDPVGQAETQLAKSIVGKIDNDLLAAAKTSKNILESKTATISYNGIVDAVDKFDEEEITDKVMFVAPAQITTLRKDANFIDKTKYGNEVMVNGEIGMIAGVRIVPSKKIKVEKIDKESTVDGYVCPVIKLEPADTETEYAETELPALTIFLKKETQVDHEWFPKKQRHDITAAKYYGVALTNASKVVVVKFKK